MLIRHRKCGWLMVACSLLATGPVEAQQAGSGHAAQTGAGEIGQRQTRLQTAPDVNVIARIDTRIQNRVQSRIRNRIDRYYDPLANAETPFKSAADQVKTVGRKR